MNSANKKADKTIQTAPKGEKVAGFQRNFGVGVELW
jgi:hypothetical protein